VEHWYNTALPQVQAGRTRVIALTAGRRGMPLPDLPDLRETVPGFVLEGWHPVMAPPRTSAPVVDRLNQAIRFALVDAAVVKRITDTSIDVASSSPAELAAIIRDAAAKYVRITQDAGIKPE